MSRHTIHQVGIVVPESDVEQQMLAEIRGLASASIGDLKAKWAELTGRDPPRFAKRSLLTQLIAWEVQARTFGGLDATLRRRLQIIGSSVNKTVDKDKPPPAPLLLRPGVTLVRSWKGTTHHVTVGEIGFVWQERTYKSLSVIAREITGTSWSGPVFFGLKKSKIASTKTVERPAGAAADG